MSDDSNERYSSKHMAEIGAKGAKAVKEKYGVEFFRAIGRRGGEKNRAKGPDYFRALGQKGGARTKALCAAAKALEAQGLTQHD